MISPLPTVEFHQPADDIVEVRFAASPNDAEFEAYIAELTARVLELPRFALLIALAHNAALDHRQREKQAQWIHDFHPVLRRNCFGAAFVMPGMVARIALASVMLMQRPPFSHTVVATRDQALAWIDEAR